MRKSYPLRIRPSKKEHNFLMYQISLAFVIVFNSHSKALQKMYGLDASFFTYFAAGGLRFILPILNITFGKIPVAGVMLQKQETYIR